MDPHAFWQYSPEVDASFIQKFQKSLRLEPERIKWLGSAPQEEMSAFYSGIDLFVSPSSFHDEDFGLTASEARMCGVKCLLTAWGGYHRFAEDSQVALIGLHETPLGFKVNQEELISGLKEFKHQVTHAYTPALETLTSEERQRVLNDPFFLKLNDHFDWELYRKIYQSYVRR